MSNETPANTESADSTASTPPARKKSICLDFDGVLHSYMSPWVNEHTIPDPAVAGATRFVKECLAAGFGVAVFSARSRTSAGIQAMKDWLIDVAGLERGEVELIQFPTHKPPAIIYIDDRGFHFTGVWPQMDYLRTFRPWNRPD